MSLRHSLQLLNRLATRRVVLQSLVVCLFLCGLALYQPLRIRLLEQHAAHEREELDQSELFDQPDEAVEYFLRKRLPPGVQDLAVEKYEAALRQMRGMRRYSAALGRQLNAKEAAEALGTWSFL